MRMMTMAAEPMAIPTSSPVDNCLVEEVDGADVADIAEEDVADMNIVVGMELPLIALLAVIDIEVFIAVIEEPIPIIEEFMPAMPAMPLIDIEEASVMIVMVPLEAWPKFSIGN
jgi:hypothetical protein